MQLKKSDCGYFILKRESMKGRQGVQLGLILALRFYVLAFKTASALSNI